MIQTISEFANRIGVPRSNIYTYGKRGKLVIIGGKIDDENGTNMVFLSTRTQVVTEKGEIKTKHIKKEIRGFQLLCNLTE